MPAIVILQTETHQCYLAVPWSCRTNALDLSQVCFSPPPTARLNLDKHLSTLRLRVSSWVILTEPEGGSICICGVNELNARGDLSAAEGMSPVKGLGPAETYPGSICY